MGIRLRCRLAVRTRMVTSVLFFGLLIVSGCQSIPKHHSSCLQKANVNLNDFEISGKLALSDGQEGGSGRFIWRQQGAWVSTQFKAPMGQGSWLIEETSDGATLIINNEDPYYAHYAETLIADAVGWAVPWQALKQWFRVRPLNLDQADVQFNQTSQTIAEQGWTIVYDRFDDGPRGCLPHRIMASKPPYSIRLVIRQWQ